MSNGNSPDRVPGFSGWKPTVDKDWRKLYEFLEAYAEAILVDPFEQGVLRDVGNELEVTIVNPANPDTDAQVDTGTAWLKDSSGNAQGLRVQLGSAQTVSLDNAATYDNIVYVKYAQTQSEFRNHYISGVSKYTRLIGGFELGAVRESLWPVTGAMPLAKVGESGGQIVVLEDLRDYFVLRPRYANVYQEFTVTCPVMYSSGTASQGLAFAVFRPDAASLRSRIQVLSVHAHNPNTDNLSASAGRVGVWDNSDKAGQNVMVDIASLAADSFAENVVGGIIGDPDTDHRFIVGWGDTYYLPATAGYTGLMVVTITIKYLLL